MKRPKARSLIVTTGHGHGTREQNAVARSRIRRDGTVLPVERLRALVATIESACATMSPSLCCGDGEFLRITVG